MEKILLLVEKKQLLTKWVKDECISEYDYPGFSMLLNDYIREEINRFDRTSETEELYELERFIDNVDNLYRDDCIGENAYRDFNSLIEKQLRSVLLEIYNNYQQNIANE